MGEKCILLAHTGRDTLEEFQNALGDQWHITPVETGGQASEELKGGEYHVLVTDIDLPELGGAELLNRAQKDHPKTVRFILASETDRDRVVKEVLGAHQFLTKPVNTPLLRNTIERALALDQWVSNHSMRELVARIRTFPAIPSLYLEVLAALRSPSATTEEVGAIIAKDMAMMTKLLQVLNSAFFGLRRRVTEPSEAVGLLGFEGVKSMVIAIKVLSECDKVRPVYFSIDRLWRHSTEVAGLSRQMALMATSDHSLAETAYTAGLMHDLGKIVLASNFDEQYQGVQSLARKQQTSLWQIEREIFGATHGEIGAYLLGLWGMPLDFLEAAALHHCPSRSIQRDFTTTTAVHIANVLEHRLNPDKDEPVPPAFDEEYLREVGIHSCIDTWCAALAQGRLSRPIMREQPSQTAATPGQEPDRPPPSPVTIPLSNPPDSPTLMELLRESRWALIGLSVCATLVVLSSLLLLLIRPGPSLTETTPDPPEDVESAITPSAEETGNDISGQADASRAVPPTLAEATAITPPSPASLIKPGEETVVRTDTETGTVPAKSSFPPVTLQGVYYRADHAVAVVNGTMLKSNDELAGMRVLKIGPSSVTLQFQNEQRTFSVESPPAKAKP